MIELSPLVAPRAASVPTRPALEPPPDRAAAPVVSLANLSGGRQVVHRLRKSLKREFGTVRPARSCEQLDAMEAWPACAELARIMHPLYLC